MQMEAAVAPVARLRMLSRSWCSHRSPCPRSTPRLHRQQRTWSCESLQSVLRCRLCRLQVRLARLRRRRHRRSRRVLPLAKVEAEVGGRQILLQQHPPGEAEVAGEGGASRCRALLSKQETASAPRQRQGQDQDQSPRLMPSVAASPSQSQMQMRMGKATATAKVKPAIMLTATMTMTMRVMARS